MTPRKQPKIRQVHLTLSIGLGGEVTDTIPLSELVEDWEHLDEEELDKALHEAWKEWAWQYIDGGAEIGK